MNLTDIVILSLATWRLTSFVANDEDGPFEMFARLRDLLGVRYNEAGVAYGETELGKAASCVWCLSIWVGLVIAILYLLFPAYTVYASLPLALSALAIGLNRYVSH